jgi:aspartate dehydrogenase
MKNPTHSKLLLVGYGAMGRKLHALLREHGEDHRIAAVLVPAAQLADIRPQIPANVLLSSDLPTALASGAGLMVECAGHPALREHAPSALQAGVDLLLASVGALADPSIEVPLRRAATLGNARIRVPSGALGGLDALAAARYAGLDEVTYVSNKAITAWRGTAAEQMIALDSLSTATVFFSGTAREAALKFPQNANVAAAVAIAGVGFDRTLVRLTADPQATGNRHRIVARGAFGSIDVTIEGHTLADNPKTSVIAPLSLLQAILKQDASLALA